MGPMGNTGATMRLLVVDDSRAVWERLLAMLGDLPGGITVAHAMSVKEAHYRLDSFSPDLVVLDANLPDGSGLDLLRGIKARLHPVQVAMFTNHPEFRQPSLELGADWFFDKSLDFQALLALLRQGAGQDSKQSEGKH